ncbi:MAG: radical SAM family heme chaperone HemW [Clostridia bacterium]|nr:radical SAM family heme chaperone HemW [Clostridia bacterium]
MEKIGLYIHIPFCVSKCPYCDFHSAALGSPLQAGAMLDTYTDALLRSMEEWAHRLPATADTLYFGGGTPSLLGGERLARVIAEAQRLFGLQDAEITLEANPADGLADTLSAFAAAGGNRLSLGMQSAVPAELTLLGRRHTPADVTRTVADARRAGIDNVSLDVMLGIGGQTVSSACYSVDTAADLGATHLSAYLLKLEAGTPYGVCPPSDLPSEDETVALYHAAFERMERHGYHQYEISNAALPNCESRHNLKYWQSAPYLGIGPAASSCLGGHRFTYPRDTAAFLRGGSPVEDPCEGAPVGSPEEYALLRLRLTAGLTAEDFTARFGAPLPPAWRKNASALPPSLVHTDGESIRLTREGFLLSNTLISRIVG